MANIVTATIALLDTKNPRDLTIRDIALASGHHHRLIVEWFGSKGGLMQAVSEHILQSVIDSGELFSSTLALRADLRKAFRIFNYMQMDYPEFVSTIEGRLAADAVVERFKALRGMSEDRARLVARQLAVHTVGLSLFAEYMGLSDDDVRAIEAWEIEALLGPPPSNG